MGIVTHRKIGRGLAMKVTERDALLIELKAGMGVLEERSESHLRELQEQSKHLAAINGKVGQHGIDIQSVITTVYGKGSDKGLCGEIITVKKIIYTILVLLAGGSIVGGLEITDVIHLLQ